MTTDGEDDLVRAIATLVESGEYRDELLGVPGANLHGSGTFRVSPSGRSQRVYQRGSRAHLEAKAAGLVERLPPLVRASPAAIAEAERRLGHALPPLLRRLYAEVGNGGFGPGYGLLGAGGGYVDASGDDAISLCEKWALPRRGLLPICEWGCGIYSLVELTPTGGRMWGYDPNPLPADRLDEALFAQGLTVGDWLGKWIAGRLYQPALVEDEASGAWRAATDEEMAQWLAEPSGET